MMSFYDLLASLPHDLGMFLHGLSDSAALLPQAALSALPGVSASSALDAAASLNAAPTADVTGPISGPVFWAIVMTIAVGKFLMRSGFVFAMERTPLTDNLKLVL